MPASPEHRSVPSDSGQGVVPPSRTSSVRAVGGPDPAPRPLTLVRAPPHLTLLRRGSQPSPRRPSPRSSPGGGGSGADRAHTLEPLHLPLGRTGLPSRARAEAEGTLDWEGVEGPGASSGIWSGTGRGSTSDSAGAGPRCSPPRTRRRPARSPGGACAATRARGELAARGLSPDTQGEGASSSSGARSMVRGRRWPCQCT